MRPTLRVSRKIGPRLAVAFLARRSERVDLVGFEVEDVPGGVTRLAAPAPGVTSAPTGPHRPGPLSGGPSWRYRVDGGCAMMRALHTMGTVALAGIVARGLRLAPVAARSACAPALHLAR